MREYQKLCLIIALSILPAAALSTDAKPGAVSETPLHDSRSTRPDASQLANHKLTMWQQGLGHDSKTRLLYLQAFAIFKSGHYKLATEKMTDVLKSNPQFWIAYEDRGYAYMKIGLFSQALNDRSRCSALNDPSGQKSGAMNVWDFNECGEYNKSAKSFAGGADSSKKWYIAAARAVCHYGLKNYDATKADLKESLKHAFTSAVTASPANDYVDPHEAFLLGLKPTEQSGDESPLLSNATLATMIALNGNCNLMSGNVEEAVKDYSTAIAVHPFIRPIYIARSLAYSRLGKEDLAEKDKKLADDRSAQETYGKSQERLKAQTTLYTKLAQAS